MYIIKDIHESDYFYSQKDRFIGQHISGNFTPRDEGSYAGYSEGSAEIIDKSGTVQYYYFFAVKLEEVNLGTCKYDTLVEQEIAKVVGHTRESRKDQKDYSGKPTYDDVPIIAFAELGRVAMAAKEKYGNTETWRNFTPESKLRYWNAGLRHAFAWIRGEKLSYAWLGDKTFDVELLERGHELSHLTLAMWNFGAAREAEMWYQKYCAKAYDEEKERDMK